MSSVSDDARQNGSSVAAKPDPLIGTTIDQYNVVRVIGIGGMARVYEALDEATERRVALKVMSVQHAADEELAQRFKREGRTLASLKHPNIVELYSVGETDHSYYIAMRFIEGQTLASVLKRLAQRGEFMPFAQIIAIVSDVGDALDYAHVQGVIHRDVKPSNIMLTPDDHAILTDFGLMMEATGGSTLGTAFGTPRYIAPEQAIASHRAVPQSDLYSLGVVLYEMQTGQTPFDHESAMSLALSHITNAPPAPRTIRPDLPVAVERVMLKALEKSPRDRYPTAKALVEALRAAYQTPFEGQLPAEVWDATPSVLPVAMPPRVLIERPEGVDELTTPGPSPSQPTALLQLRNSLRKKRRTIRLFPLVFAAVLTIFLLGLTGLSAVALRDLNTPIIIAPDSTVTPIPPRLRLVYSEHWLAIFNATQNSVSLDGVTFARANLTFDPSHQVGSQALKNMPSGGCVQIRITGDSDTSAPFMCDSQPDKHLIFIQPSARFWQASTDGALTFTVRQAQTVLQTCQIILNTCDFSLP
jgi:serine/threonine protein kinase